MKKKILWRILFPFFLASSIFFIGVNSQFNPTSSQFNPTSSQFIPHSTKSDNSFGLLFNTTALNWSFQCGYQWTGESDENNDYIFKYYYHFNITCSLSKDQDDYVFNFTYRTQINTERTDEPLYGWWIDDNLLIHPYSILRIQLYHENYVDIAFLWNSNPSNELILGNFSQFLVIYQQEAPSGFSYHWIYHLSESSSGWYIRSDRASFNQSALPSYYDGYVLWVKDFSNFTYHTNFYFPDFQFSLHFNGSHTAFLGTKSNPANSTIDIDYQQVISHNPLIISQFNITLSWMTHYYNIYQGSELGGWFEYFHPDIVINQNTYQNISLQNFHYQSENIEHDSYTKIDDKKVWAIFNATFLSQTVLFQFNHYPKTIPYELEIRQIIPKNTDSIGSFDLVIIIGGMIVTFGLMVFLTKKEKFDNKF